MDTRGCEVSRAAVVWGAGVEASGEAVGGACVVSWKALYTGIKMGTWQAG